MLQSPRGFSVPAFRGLEAVSSGVRAECPHPGALQPPVVFSPIAFLALPVGSFHLLPLGSPSLSRVFEKLGES